MNRSTLLTLGWLLLGGVGGLAQDNLVINPSFEIHKDNQRADHCGIGMGGIESGEAVGWFTPTYSSDLYSPCVVRERARTPAAWLGYQEPRTDSSYAGIWFVKTYVDTMGSREYLGGTLVQSLSKDTLYVASTYVSLADWFPWALDGLEIWLADTVKLYGQVQPNRYWFVGGDPQVRNQPGTYLEDTVNWMQICDTFTARGNEKYLLIGNFTDSLDIPSRHIGGLDSINGIPNIGSSYYYFDDVSVYRVPGGLQGRQYRHRLCGDALPQTLRGRGDFLTYRWSTGESGPTIEVTTAGTYWVEQTLECVSVVDTHYVTVETPVPAPELGEDRYHCADDRVQPVTLSAGQQPNYRWSTGETTPEITVLDSGLYSIEVDYDWCETRRDTVRLLGCPPNYEFRLVLPNIFTPNDDGLNDRFRPMEAHNLDLVRTTIYDRWGRVVYRQGPSSPDWDGLWRGQAMPEGVYYYRVEFHRPVTGVREERKGKVTLKR
ncbi:MAG: gliding motility-associated C-terminal domain-containing protein [Bacteroidota bacterium]